jgi:beta-galactosidase
MKIINEKKTILLDAGGAIKRLSDEYVRFTVEGELIGGLENEINPQKMFWGEAVALVRSSTKSGTIKITTEVLKEENNAPDIAEIEFTTIAPNQNLLFSELPKKGTKKTTQIFINESETLKKIT